MLDRQGYGGQDLASACLVGVNECGQRWRRFVVNSPGKQREGTSDTPAAAGTFTWAIHMNTFVRRFTLPSQPRMCSVQLLRRQIYKWKRPSVSGRGVGACLLEDIK